MTIPLLLNTKDGFAWPADATVFYVLGSDGLFICRAHEFFESCAPARTGPGELEPLTGFMRPRFPRIPRGDFERVVGFFDAVGTRCGGEAAVMFFWDREAEKVRIIVPEQTATVTSYRDGYRTPVGLHYVPPVDLPPHWVPFGDAHSHVHLSAYCSHTDKQDETHETGLHLVVGRIGREPPDLHVEAVVDGTRYELEFADAVEGYERRQYDFPPEWMGKVKVETTWSSEGLEGSSGDSVGAHRSDHR